MSLDLNEIAENLDNALNSEEGQELTRKYFEKQDYQEKILDNQIERFHLNYSNRLDEVIEYVSKKYNSDQYVRREYKLGFEPREDLYWFLLFYARKYSEACNDEQYINEFTYDIYYLGSYVIQVMYGQGSVIRIDKRTWN